MITGEYIIFNVAGTQFQLSLVPFDFQNEYNNSIAQHVSPWGGPTGKTSLSC